MKLLFPILSGTLLLLLLQVPALANPDPVPEVWICSANCGCTPRSPENFASIRPIAATSSGMNLIVRNECGEESSGIQTAQTISAPDWNMSGSVAQDQIIWDNGTIWQRQKPDVAELDRRMGYWEGKTFRCMFSDPARKLVVPGFPSKASERDDGKCDDGDSVMENALLCYSGDSRGCDAVRRSQDENGRWWRSPRAATEKLDEPSDWLIPQDGQTTFSNDHAGGVILYLAVTQDSAAFKKWIAWIDQNPRCRTLCLAMPHGTPRYCENDRCAFHVGDCFMLQALGEYLDVTIPFCTVLPFMPPDPIVSHAEDLKRTFDETIGKLPIIPPDLKLLRDNFDGRIVDYKNAIAEAQKARSKLERMLLKDVRMAQIITEINLTLNKRGFSRHNSMVDILTLEIVGNGSKQLSDLAKNVAADEPKNPFFQYIALRGSSPTQAISLILTECPDEKEERHPRTQWAWEREQGEEAWKKSMYWDCLFIGRAWQKNAPLPAEAGQSNFFEQAAADAYNAAHEAMVAAQRTLEDLIDQIKRLKPNSIVLGGPLPVDPKILLGNPIPIDPRKLPNIDFNPMNLFGNDADSSGGRINANGGRKMRPF